MPKRRRRRLRRRRRRRRRRKRKMVRYRTPIPLSRRVRFKWVQLGKILNAGGSLHTHVFNANWMQQPSGLDATHQPLLYDQLLGFYETVHLHRSHMKVQLFTKATASSQIPVIAMLDSSVESTVPTNIITEIENRGTKWKMMGERDGRLNGVKFSATYTPRKLKLPASSTELVTDYDDASNAPLARWYWHLTCANLDGTGNLADVDYVCTIWYDVLLSSPLDQISS